MGSYIAVASKVGVHLWDIHNNSPTVHSTLVPADDLVQGQECSFAPRKDWP